MTQHFATRQLRFFLTAPQPCPYLPGREERKVFAHLPLSEGALVNDALTQVGFRRSQNIAYRPACEGCDACTSARIPVAEYPCSRSERRILERNDLLSRHMVEDTAVRTHIVEYRLPSNDRGPGDLIACVLVDVLGDGLSLVYSFFDPAYGKHSLGAFVILDHVVQATLTGMPYVYLGYWVSGSVKMDYKSRFRPLEVLKPGGWVVLSERDRRGG